MLLVCANQVAAEQPVSFHKGLSMQGYTGILNTPNARVTDEGWLYALYTNQQENKWRHQTPFQDNYLFSLGLFNFIELGGRFFEAPSVGRDLSANVKITSAPLTRNYPLVPVIAAGAQDPSGGAVFLNTSYVVLSEEIWRLRLSVGYGLGPDRMKGSFGGGEFKVHDWVYLLGEYDTSETNVGIRAVLPPFWKVPASFTVTAKTALDYRPGNFEVAAGLNFPLDFKVRGEERGARLEKKEPKNPEFRIPNPEPRTPNPEPRNPNLEPRNPNLEPRTNLTVLFDKLIREGFLNVRVGISENTLVVEYENTIFNHNELDALGLVAGLACEEAPEGVETLRLVVKKRNIRMATISMPMKYVRTFLIHNDGRESLRDNLVVDFASDESGNIAYIQNSNNSGMLNTSLVLAPGLKTFVGTEVGAFDYLISLRPELTTALWKGAAVNGRWDLPLTWSDNLENGMLYRSSRQPAQMDRLMLFQAIKPLSTVMLNLGGGMVVHDRYGMLNEASWSPGEGEHRFRIVQGWNENSMTSQQSNMLLVSYRYFYCPLDISLVGTAGRFWAEDEGFSLELKRFWEDTAVSLYYKGTKGIDQKSWKSVGIQFSFPLTPRRDMKPLANIQVRGSDEWVYGQESTLKNNNPIGMLTRLNYLPSYMLAIDPQPSTMLSRTFFNRDRLSANYIRQHLDRLREAWVKYRTINNL